MTRADCASGHAGLGIDDFRAPGIFGPELPASDAAPAHGRLLAFLGRDVSTIEAAV